MSSQVLDSLIAAIVPLIGAAVAYLKARTAAAQAAAAHQRLDNLPPVTTGQKGAS